jgi:SNF2 family DNA or RNA helicase
LLNLRVWWLWFARRLKGDVEKSLPPKEETLVEVELTSLQKRYYRAVYDRNAEQLCKMTHSKVRERERERERESERERE